MGGGGEFLYTVLTILSLKKNLCLLSNFIYTCSHTNNTYTYNKICEIIMDVAFNIISRFYSSYFQCNDLISQDSTNSQYWYISSFSTVIRSSIQACKCVTETHKCLKKKKTKQTKQVQPLRRKSLRSNLVNSNKKRNT